MTVDGGWEAVLASLDHYRALILGKVADELTYTIPMLGVPNTAADPLAHHQRQMYETVARLHDGIQAMRLNEELLAHEFAWAADVLPRWGVTLEHLVQMIDVYIDTARAVGMWGRAERDALEDLRAHLRQIAQGAFS